MLRPCVERPVSYTTSDYHGYYFD